MQLSEDLSCQFFPEHRVLHFCSPPWTPFQGVLRVSGYSSSWFNPCRGTRQVPTCTWHLNVLRVHPCWARCQNSLPVWGWIILHYLRRPGFDHPFICQWALWLFLPFCCCQCGWASICVRPCLQFLSVYPEMELFRAYGHSVFNFFVESGHTVFHCSCVVLHSHRQCTKLASLHLHQYLALSGL